MNAVQQLPTFGQSPWLDFIRRGYTRDGSLKQLIAEHGIRGVTSNPAIFEQAIAGSSDYDEAISVFGQKGLTSDAIYDCLSVEDVAEAADIFLPVYKDTNGLDGYVSLEVSPLLAHDTEGTLEDARRLWKELGRPNVMIKVPATKAGIPAIEQLLTEGINVNITLLFGLDRYREVAEAYVRAMTTRARLGENLKVASVASFFVSRMDSLVDPLLEKSGSDAAKSLVGTIAVANCQAAYGIYTEIFKNSSWADLQAQAAWPQRLLWASTSTKNPAFSKVKYVESLIGEDTVNTMPLATILDYAAEGQPANRLTDTLDSARSTLAQLETLGFSLTELADQLESEAVAKFVDPFNSLLASIEKKRAMAGAL